MAWKTTLFRGLILPDTPNKYIILCNIKQLVASLTAPLLRYIYCKDEHQGALPDSSLNLPNELPKITKKVLSDSGARRSMMSTGVNSSGGNLDFQENPTGLDYMAQLKFYACIGKGM